MINIKPILPSIKHEWLISSGDTRDYDFTFEDNDETEEPVADILPIDISYRGVGYVVYILPSREALFINEKLLKPFNIKSYEGPVFYVRNSPVYGNYLAIKDGLILKGIILPTKLIREDETDFVDVVRELYEVCTIEQANIERMA